MGKVLKSIASIFTGPRIKMPQITIPTPPPAPPPPPPPAPPAAAEVAKVDASDPEGLDNAAARAAQTAALVGRRKLKIPLIAAATGGSGIAIPR